MNQPSRPDSLDRERVRAEERDLYRRLLELGGRESLSPFLSEALGLIVEVTRARQGYLEVRDPHANELDDAWSLAFGCSDDEIQDIKGSISRGIIAAALATGETMLTHSAMIDARFSGLESVQRSHIDSVLCAPIGGNAALGVVYLQGRQDSGLFSDADQETAEIFALHLAPIADRLLMRHHLDVSQDATHELRSRYQLGSLVGRSRAFASAVEQAMLAAPLDVTVLLTGASGTGKTEIANVIHANSSRAQGPFVEINCASLPENLIESELFGARAGAHSEAKRDIEGKVAAAAGGTLFLDEVSDLPMAAQAKLLQLLQSKKYYALGATSATPADVRVIAASNADLEQRVAEKRFRDDLFYRLNVLPVRVPSLSERRDDLPVLADALRQRAIQRHKLPHLGFSPAALQALVTPDWPGNVRQLENTVEAALIRAAGEKADEIALRHVHPERAGQEAEAGGTVTYQEATRGFQRELLARTLRETEWNVSEAARRLDLARSHVYQLISTFDLRREGD